MPPKSRQQAKAMFAAKAGKSTLGIPQSVGADFVTSLIGHPGAVNALPQTAGPTHIHVHIHNPPAPKPKKRAAVKPPKPGYMP